MIWERKIQVYLIYVSPATHHMGGSCQSPTTEVEKVYYILQYDRWQKIMLFNTLLLCIKKVFQNVKNTLLITKLCKWNKNMKCKHIRNNIAKVLDKAISSRKYKIDIENIFDHIEATDKIYKKTKNLRKIKRIQLSD